MPIAVEISLAIFVVLCLVWLDRRLRRMEAFWQVVGHITDAELLALQDFRKAAKRLESRAEEDARLEARRKLQRQPVPPPTPKTGRSSDLMK